MGGEKEIVVAELNFSLLEVCAEAEPVAVTNEKPVTLPADAGCVGSVAITSSGPEPSLVIDGGSTISGGPPRGAGCCAICCAVCAVCAGGSIDAEGCFGAGTGGGGGLPPRLHALIPGGGCKIEPRGRGVFGWSAEALVASVRAGGGAAAVRMGGPVERAVD